MNVLYKENGGGGWGWRETEGDTDKSLRQDLEYVDTLFMIYFSTMLFIITTSLVLRYFFLELYGS
jgi:hypothetical protein